PGHQVLDCLARQRHWVTRHQAVGTGSPGIGIVWLDSGHRVTRYDSGHWVTRHQVIWLASRHRVIWQGSGHRVTRYRIIWINSGHRVNWPNRIIRLDQFIMLGRGIR
ncbi:unnamed protein product, partial [Staurois parvus]